ncbi:MerR family transcriptional regulator [Methylomarinum vadi]|uniref:MerR family transcriptional regulator n=1 Tax=Methylomarinum vadi TaxID=438855 RepID=UPI0004DEE514|nr:MerR family transcriptional regulator [Methylomarinum vadi]
MKLTIGKLAKHSGVTIETIRHYQRIGLLDEPEKPPGGYRLYPAEAVSRLRFIKRAQRAGFTLKEVAVLLSLDGKQCVEACRLAEQKCREIDRQIDALTTLKQALQQLVDDCRQTGSSEQCAVLNAFNDDDTASSD